MSKFGDELKRIRKERNLSQKELARRAGISKAYVSAIERDFAHSVTGALPKPSVENIDKLADALRWSRNEARNLVGYAPQNIPPPIVEAIGTNELSERDIELVADFIRMLINRNKF